MDLDAPVSLEPPRQGRVARRYMPKACRHACPYPFSSSRVPVHVHAPTTLICIFPKAPHACACVCGYVIGAVKLAYAHAGMHVHRCVHRRVYRHVHRHLYGRTCLWTCIWTRVWTHVSTCASTRTRADTCMDTRMDRCMGACMDNEQGGQCMDRCLCSGGAWQVGHAVQRHISDAILVMAY